MEQVHEYGAIIKGQHRITRVELQNMYKLSNNKCQRLLERSDLQFVYEYDRRFYDYTEATTYFKNVLTK